MFPILATKIRIPARRPKLVLRPHLIERLNEGLDGKLTLVSAPAGFGKSTLVSEWAAVCGRRVAWVSLDEGDNDPSRVLAYLAAGLQSLDANVGDKALSMLLSPRPAVPEAVVTVLLNDISAIREPFAFVLDDYHVIRSKAVHRALTVLIEHLPPHMHLLIATREDPELPLARLRARRQLTELRAADLRFSQSEASRFLNRVMGLSLSAEHVAALEARTEGWIAGLQLAAISMQGRDDPACFIRSFTGSHRFVMDYLAEEVLQKLPESIQTFLLRTSILARMCGELCDAVVLDPDAPGAETLEYLERANLFVVPLDNERRWYRYHHLFADLLRQRLGQGECRSAYHIRASQWYEENGLEIDAFHHAAAANDIERAERLIDGNGIPLHFRGAVTAVLDWLASLPASVLDARPSLRFRHGSLLLVVGQTTGVEEKLRAAEAALSVQPQATGSDEVTRNLRGQIAAARSVLALTRYQPEIMMSEALRALEHLRPDSHTSRATALWTLGCAYLLQGDRVAAGRTLAEAVSLSRSSGNLFTLILATIGMGMVQELENQLHAAAQTYQSVLQVAGDQPLQIVYEAHLGLARVLYEWNDLDGAELHGQKGLELARLYDGVIDRFVICEVFLTRLKLARGDVTGAAALIAHADRAARRGNFVHRFSEVAGLQVLILLRQGRLEAAAALAQSHDSAVGQARVHLVRGDAESALAVLEPWRLQMEARGWADERLKVLVLQAVALHARGERDKALPMLADALALAEPGGFIRTFVDEGRPMQQLLTEAAELGIRGEYAATLLQAFDAAQRRSDRPAAQPLTEPLSPRELTILQLIAQGLSNREISERLFLALDTVKGHNRRLFEKMQVRRRTEAVARARELGLC